MLIGVVSKETAEFVTYYFFCKDPSLYILHYIFTEVVPKRCNMASAKHRFAFQDMLISLPPYSSSVYNFCVTSTVILSSGM
jgi:hypothetical protein